VLTPTTSDAFKLLMRGEQALTTMSINGMKIDRDYYAGLEPEIINEAAKLESAILNSTEIGSVWSGMFSTATNLDSAEQLKKVLLSTGFDRFKTTEKGGLSADKEVIAKLPYEFSSRYLKYKQLKKAWRSIIQPMIRECDDKGFIHPLFNLHTVSTYRSSCSDPNLQQVSKHDKTMKRLVRTGCIPRTPDRQLLEIDLKSNEVSVGCCLHKDKQMLKFLQDPAADMHKTVSTKYYRLKAEEYLKELRDSTKGRIVFASFYGAGYESIATSMWEYITEENPKLATGEELKIHMQRLGINNFEDCKTYTEKFYDWYWHTLFKEYDQWKTDTWNQYCKVGYVDMPTGFRAVSAIGKTQLINLPIQGAAFHVLLATAIGLVKRMQHYKLKSLAIGQIHDSVLLDIVPEELQQIVEMYMDSQDDVRKMWPWLIYPIGAEADVSKVGGNWCDMESIGLLQRAA